MRTNLPAPHFMLACLALVFSIFACTFGSAPPTDSSSPNNDPSSSNPTQSAPSGNAAGPGEIVVQGDLNIRFQPSIATASPLADQVTIALLKSDDASGVRLFIPADIQPGTYPIGDLFNLSEAEVTARFDDVESGYNAYESTSGMLTLTQTGSSFSGSFTFTAVHTPDGSRPVTVEGNFEGVQVP